MVIAKQIARYLQQQGLGTIATDLFFGMLPDNSGSPLICVLSTGGLKPSIDIPTKRPTFQVFVRASTFIAGQEKIDAIRLLLHRKAGETLVSGGDFFYTIHAQSEGGHIGRNAAGLDEFSINFECLTR